MPQTPFILSMMLLAWGGANQPVGNRVDETSPDAGVEASRGFSLHIDRGFCQLGCAAYSLDLDPADSGVAILRRRLGDGTLDSAQRVPLDEVSRLRIADLVKQASVDATRAQYVVAGSDGQASRIQWTLAGAEHSVLDLGGQSAGTPASILQLEAEADAIAHANGIG